MADNLWPPSRSQELRWLAHLYEQAQAIRLEAGERIRAILQGRDPVWPGLRKPSLDVGRILERIKSGQTPGPVPVLGRTYSRYWREERDLQREMLRSVREHPAWAWLAQIRGVGATLACKLLSRLDVQKAQTPSAFWAYCGLATVPGTEYRCPDCGLVKSFPSSYHVTGAHRAAGQDRPCPGRLVRCQGPETGIRVAQPRPRRGERAVYDQYAKKVCYLIGTSFVRAGGAYAQHYRRQRVRLESIHPGWSSARIHLAALRNTEKLFLAHLWVVWRQAIAAPITSPYGHRQNGRTYIDPWSMVERKEHHRERIASATGD